MPARPLTTWEEEAGAEPRPQAGSGYCLVRKLKAKEGQREQAKDQGSQCSNCEGARASVEKPMQDQTTHILTLVCKRILDLLLAV